MKNLSLLTLLSVAVLLAGCSFTDSQCGCLPSNCCSWDFYKPCDLIEGRIDSNCPQVCGEPRCVTGVVSTRCYELPVTEAPAPQPEVPQPEIVIEEAPPAGPEGE